MKHLPAGGVLRAMGKLENQSNRWLDILWLVFLAGLALLSPIAEIHKQLTLLAIGAFQLVEGRLVRWLPGRGRAYAVLIKILLGTLLIGHTGGPGINSSYYPIYYVPVVTAALYYGPVGTLLWTFLASLAYCFYLIPALQEYQLTVSGASELGIRILFFFLAAMVVNRFVMESRRHTERYRILSETLASTNRRLQQAEAEARRSERLAALGQLSAGLAHEIRNPLGVIKGSAEMLRGKLQASNSLASELSGFISAEVNRLNALIARFLDFARPSRVDLRPLDVCAVLDRALDSVRKQFPDAPVTVERNYPNGPLLAPLDEQLSEQMFVNLIQNAYEAMGSRQGTLRLNVAPAAINGRAGVEVEVQDTGPGIPPELREAIFNPFVTSKKSGMGLGLSIVAKIVDDHHGVVRLASHPTQGTTFRVFFPASEEAARDDASPSPPTAVPAA